jgi:GNAT superfamily N-acetyltransferase
MPPKSQPISGQQPPTQADAQFHLVIRDALNADITACMGLDHHYETEHVWQMTLQSDSAGWQVRFRTEKLPRRIEVTYPMDEKRLRLALPADSCFIVATGHDGGGEAAQHVLGYLTMRYDPVHNNATIQDLVVDRPLRRYKVGSRLLNVARQWALEKQAWQLLIETQTTNYPGIQFCQINGLQFCGFNDRYYPNQDIAVFFHQTLA